MSGGGGRREDQAHGAAMAASDIPGMRGVTAKGDQIRTRHDSVAQTVASIGASRPARATYSVRLPVLKPLERETPAMSETNQPPGTSPESEADFDANMARIGHTVPQGRRKGLLAAYTDMRRQAAVIRQTPIDAAREPSNTFSLVPFLSTPKGE